MFLGFGLQNRSSEFQSTHWNPQHLDALAGRVPSPHDSGGVRAPGSDFQRMQASRVDSTSVPDDNLALVHQSLVLSKTEEEGHQGVSLLTPLPCGMHLTFPTSPSQKNLDGLPQTSAQKATPPDHRAPQQDLATWRCGTDQKLPLHPQTKSWWPRPFLKMCGGCDSRTHTPLWKQ